MKMTRFEKALFCESARWGYMGKVPPYTKTDLDYLPDDRSYSESKYGDWDRNVRYRLNEWLPQRRNYYLDRMFAAFAVQP